MLILLSICAVSFLRSNVIRLIGSLMASCFLVLILISFYSTGNFLNYGFYVHLNYEDILSMLPFFKGQAIGAILVFILFTGLYYFSGAVFLSKNFLRNPLVRIGIILMCIGMGSLKHGIVRDVSNLASITQISSSDQFDANLKKLGINNYVSPADVTGQPGKNIIVISLESYERALLDTGLNHISPHLQKLKKDWRYYNMKQTPGSSWTSGSLYTYLTGLPAFFNIHGNSIFQTTYKSKLTGISHVLESAGYNMTYLTSDAGFSGTNDLLNTFGINNIIDRTVLKKKYPLSSENQIHDKDLFDEAKAQIYLQKDNKEPFSLFISTISTHFPNGIYDKRMEEVISTKDSQLEFMAAAVDYLTDDFIRFLEKEKLLDNTVIYIFPDHLMMGKKLGLNDVSPRGLYLITNADSSRISIPDSTLLYQIDLPKIILDGAGVSHNANFLTESIKNDKVQFIKNNINTLTGLNTSGLVRAESKTNFWDRSMNKIKYKLKPVFGKKTKHVENMAKQKKRFIAHAGGKIDGHIYTNSLEALNKSYQAGFKLFELDILKTSDGKYVAGHDWNYWAKISGYKGELPVSEQEFLSHKLLNKLTPLNMDRIYRWFEQHPDAILVTDGINEPEEFAKNFVDKKRLMMELFTLDAVKKGIEVGIKSAMPSQNVIDQFGDNKFAVLHNLRIKDIAVSRTFIESNIELLILLKQHHINTYIYHVNFVPGIDEQYILDYEINYVYGMYADEWKF